MLLLLGCANGTSESEEGAPPPPQGAEAQYTVGGTVSGLAGSGLVLQNNGGDNLAVSADGAITFSTQLADGAQYNVTVFSQPSDPAQTCTVTNGSGTIAGSSVTNLAVTCATNAPSDFTIGGTVSGLAGSGLVLSRNGEEDLTIVSNGSFTFAMTQADGTEYEVTVRTQPSSPPQACTVANGRGTVAGANVTNIAVTCASNTFSVSGNVSAVLGEGLVLQNNGGDDVEVASSGAFTFPTRLASGASYDVTVRTQPTEPTQACTIANGSGTISDADISNVEVNCTTSEFMIGGSVSGLAGSGLVLRNNGGDDLELDANGSFTFPTALQSGSSYQVTVASQPTDPTQTCSLANASGTVGGSDVTDIKVTCITEEFTVGGSVSGLAGSGLVLLNNGEDELPIASNGRFTFPASLPSGTPYTVTVASQPTDPTQECTVTNGSGTVADSDVTDVQIQCVTRSFTIGGHVSGLQGLGLAIENNGTDRLVLLSNGSFTFDTPLESGTTYNVTVAEQPVLPSQTCVVQNGTGTVGGENVTNVSVRCSN